jgi:1-acyl-sn-glycerol-3-phosphate acyltransferase
MARDDKKPKDVVAQGADRAADERAKRQRRVNPLLAGAESPPPSEVPVLPAPVVSLTGVDLTSVDLTGSAQAGHANGATQTNGADSRGRVRPVRLKRPVRHAGGPVPRPSLRPAELPTARLDDAPPSESEPRPTFDRPEQDWLDQVMPLVMQAGDALLKALAAPNATDTVDGVLTFLRRRLTADYEVDDFGFDQQLTETVLLALLRPLFRNWFRVEVRGIENVPAEGGALIVANHSGTIALDSLMTLVAVHDEHPQHRFLRLLGADLVFQTPVVGELARKSGATLATNADAERLLTGGNVVGVFPEGFKGIGKPFSERYKLQRFGRGGFVSAAIRTGVPIIPCAIVGAEETYPIIGDLPAVARLLGMPYAPITPTWPLLGPLGMIPLPSKWLIEFCSPVPTDAYGRPAADDPMLVFEITDQVRQTIQQTLYSLLVQRRSVFF